MESTHPHYDNDLDTYNPERHVSVMHDVSFFSDFDIGLFKAGTHYHLYNKLGAHAAEFNGQQGTYFAVWAPNARHVSVIGNFNGWDRYSHPLQARWDGSGIWEGFLTQLGDGELYKYFIESHNGYQVEKGDPFATSWEIPPKTSSKIAGTHYDWSDSDWMRERTSLHPLQKPLSIYEVHLGSWRRPSGEDRFMTYREMADELPEYCSYMGFTHVEFMPVMEHPFYGSWGYQLTGYFAPSSRFGTPQDFMYLVDKLHQANVGVLLDWVPSHFPSDQHGLGYFDGTHLYEHEDPRKGYHPDWKSLIFNYGRPEVKSFLISNALYWLEKYHIDGLRVDAVASMLYLDYSRKEGEWIPNEFGGRENLEAIAFLKEFNDAVHTHAIGAFTVAEESTSFTGVTHPTDAGGLGFDLKWMMGWMNDTLTYFEKEPIYRSYIHGMVPFSMHYFYSEKFVLPLSHDEVVYGKHSLLEKMPGDDWQRFANLRLLYGYMYGHPGAKLIFMGGDIAQRHEWQHDYSLDWHENDYPSHNGIQSLLRDLNHLYSEEPAMYERSYYQEGFEWIDHQDGGNSVLSWIRKGADRKNDLIFIANFTPVVRTNYRIGVPQRGTYKEVFSTDDKQYWGSGVHNEQPLVTAPIPKHGRSHSIPVTLPPLGVIVLRHVS